MFEATKRTLPFAAANVGAGANADATKQKVSAKAYDCLIKCFTFNGFLFPLPKHIYVATAAQQLPLGPLPGVIA